MSRLDDASDWLSPIVVKELRQMVRGREFNYSLGLGLVAGLMVAFFGSYDAESGNPVSGVWVFGALTGILAFIGLVIAPVGTFGSLRRERVARTLDLVTLTALSPRRLVVGKLAAQGVKLLTLFAGFAPFIAMSFLLGGIDFLTILIALLVLFMWSLWACAACLFLSCFTKSRAVSAVLLGGVFLFLLVVGMVGLVFPVISAMASGGYPGGVFSMMFASAGSAVWWILLAMTTIFGITLMNLVLLAENRLLLPTDDRTTALRVGFFLQFLLIVVWAAGPAVVNSTGLSVTDSVGILALFGGLHLTGVAIFSVTENLTPPRRVLRQAQPSGWRSRAMAIFRPGGGVGAGYVLVQMALMLLVGRLFLSDSPWIGYLLASCSYICFYTGVPTLLARLLLPSVQPEQLRVGILLLFPVVMLLPDFVYYVLFRQPLFDIEFSARHVVNPFRTLDNWAIVEGNGWHYILFAMGVIGLLSYLALIKMGWRAVKDGTSVAPAIAAGGSGYAGTSD